MNGVIKVTGNLKTNFCRITSKIEEVGPYKLTDMIRATVELESFDYIEQAYDRLLSIK